MWWGSILDIFPVVEISLPDHDDSLARCPVERTRPQSHVREEQAPNEVCSVLKLQCFLKEILLFCTESIGGQHETESSL